MEERNCNTK